MKRGNTEYQASKDATPAEVRIRTNMHATLVTKFVDLMKAYNEVQTEYQANSKERLTRQCKVVRPELEDEEVKAIVESGDTQVFASAILDKDLREKARQALAFVENKHNDILRLQQSINELHQMFLDMATLVASQGELVDQIEDSCAKAEMYMERAVDELRKTNRLQRKSRKRMCILIIIIVAVLVALIIVGSSIAAVFAGKK
jgi:t-SNARE complex subunit (syntaxin)